MTTTTNQAQTKPRSFTDSPAVREKTPLLVGIVSPSGAGKTVSALRLATGIQRVAGGEIGVIDTEARRALHYAPGGKSSSALKFKFRHLDFGAPFGPLDYLGAIRHFVGKGVTTIIVDSMSHEHEGPGGVLEMHEAELDRMSKGDEGRRDSMNIAAWGKPKRERRKLINAILQMPANFIFCFRAKEKIRPVRGKAPLALGFQAISGDEWIYEMQLKLLLLPGSDGVPTLKSDMPGEQQIIKVPEQFRSLFAGSGRQLNEDIGQQLAEWAAGGAVAEVKSADDLAALYAKCPSSAAWRQIEADRRVAWDSLSRDDKARIKKESDDAKERLDLAERTFKDTPVGDDDDDDGDVPLPSDEHAA